MRYLAPYPLPSYSVWNHKKPTRVQNPELIVEKVQEIFQTYGFLIVTERMDESLTVLALLLGVDVGDVLVTSSKVAGSRFHLLGDNRCVPTRSYIPLKAVEDYLRHDEWRAKNYGDFLLHAIAIRSLDRTIRSLQPEFDIAHRQLLRLKRLERQVCADVVEFPCTADGRPQPNVSKTSCYRKDFGCGYLCIDSLLGKAAS